jgi:lipoprotein NlpD
MDYKTVASINNIRAPYTIYVGQKLRFRGSQKTSNKPIIKTTTAKRTSSPPPNKTSAKKPTNTVYSANRALTWQWPVFGNIISTYSENAAGRKGIDIAGKSGQSIKAAAAGKVVYSGNGLARYGNLIIIKHNDAYLSAYAHNKALLVKEGQSVEVGQKIATLGRTGTQRDQLHFEIRRNGKPVDPMRFLPKR